MKSKLLSLLAGAAMLGFAGTAFAQGPVPLTNNQLDNVTAGAFALSLNGGVAFGTVASAVTITANAIVAGSSALGSGQVISAAADFGGMAIAGAQTSILVTSP